MASKSDEPPPGNGSAEPKFLNRADEVDELLKAVQQLIIPFIRQADSDASSKFTGHGVSIPGSSPRAALVEHHPPQKLMDLMGFSLPGDGKGKEGLLEVVEKVLRYSVNTWDQGFLDKLYASTNAVGVVSELLLAVLNTNVHVYAVSPALTILEKTTSRSLASLYGFTSPRSGGISTQGGSASNTTSLIIARNTLYPSTRTLGNQSHNFVIFTSAHGHYSLEKATQMCGLGTNAVIPVPVDYKGRMIPEKLEEFVKKSKDEGKTPFYVNATAGTTVLGSFDPFTQISQVCKRHNLWLHIDGSWGAPVIFSPKHAHKMEGSELADSIAMNPHKMLNVPLTCSFLLGPDMQVFHKANTLPAGYLFHSDDPDSSAANEEVWDLADLTLQCGRRGDSLKLALSWVYHGSSGFASQIDNAFDTTAYFVSLLTSSPNFLLVSDDPPPCLQVCFYYAKNGEMKEGKEQNGKRTSDIVKKLVPRGFMVDYAPGERGLMFRVVVNVQTRSETVEGLVRAIEEVGGDMD
ncbi:glutamate decarboxylase-like protein-like protein 1 [Amylocarpus encephaloides]|uniref:Glutamate decarboxylase-like protein-like protein 1 n=1 Tax=Amylocarpus encephaloides TaxID=45428 RepID=A0A9P7YG63_9HELO|nr:glutamate decarboxylase-like protein-like protein 1 [Amylocarpus encephaloides]